MEDSGYDYVLPEDRIRLRPPPRREDSRLLLVSRTGNEPKGLSYRGVSDLPAILSPGDLLVVNDSRVVPARVTGTTDRGRPVELLFLGPFDRVSEGVVKFLGRGLRSGTLIHLFSGRATVAVWAYADQEGCFLGEYLGEFPIETELATEGEMPLPPYIAKRRKADASDRERYQTVFSRIDGSVAAPTAGLHLGHGLLDRLAKAGVSLSPVTLHVGMGTFRPLTEGGLDAHRMHSEWFSVPEETARLVALTNEAGGRVIAVGTTALRALESSFRFDRDRPGKRICSGSGWTDLFIRPGHAFGPVDGLLTNFHTPRSTLLVLVDAFLGGNRWRPIYEDALKEGFMFLSYGDAMLIL